MAATAADWQRFGPILIGLFDPRARPSARLLLREAILANAAATLQCIKSYRAAQTWALTGHSSELCNDCSLDARVPSNMILLCPVPPGQAAWADLLCLQSITAMLKQADPDVLIRTSISAFGGLLATGGKLRVYFPGEDAPKLFMSFAPAQDELAVNKMGLYALPMPSLFSGTTCAFSRKRAAGEAFPAEITHGSRLVAATPGKDVEWGLKYDPDAQPSAAVYFLPYILQSLGLQHPKRFHVVWAFGCRSSCEPLTSCSTISVPTVHPTTDGPCCNQVVVEPTRLQEVQPSRAKIDMSRKRRLSDAMQRQKFGYVQ